MIKIQTMFYILFFLIITGCAPKTYTFQSSTSGKSFLIDQKDAFSFNFYTTYAPPLVKGDQKKAIAILLYRDNLDHTYYDKGVFIDLHKKPYSITNGYGEHKELKKTPDIPFKYRIDSIYSKGPFRFAFKRQEILIGNGYPKIYFRWEPSTVDAINGKLFTKGDVFILVLTENSTKKEKEVFWHYANRVLRAEIERKKREQEQRAAMLAVDRYLLRVMSNFSSQLSSTLHSSSNSSVRAGCQNIFHKCMRFCDMKSQKGFFDDKSSCQGSCYSGKSACEKGQYSWGKRLSCSGVCKDVNEGNGGLFSSSSYDKCIDQCIDEIDK